MVGDPTSDFGIIARMRDRIVEEIPFRSGGANQLGFQFNRKLVSRYTTNLEFTHTLWSETVRNVPIEDYGFETVAGTIIPPYLEGIPPNRHRDQLGRTGLSTAWCAGGCAI